ncbi:MAG: hypothetical protein PWP51_1973 [Clostridiales bacterium]|jgi:hypothetical protein|nr:hypothetical protein [Clostridiales bacterium]MDN5299420.1 hypothetical protein [Clostridiales bacterium]
MLELFLMIIIGLFLIKFLFSLGFGIMKIIFSVIGLAIAFVLLPIGFVFLLPIAILLGIVTILKLIF